MLYVGIIFRLIVSVAVIMYWFLGAEAPWWEAIMVGMAAYSVISYYGIYLRWNRGEKVHEHAVKGYHWEPVGCLGVIIEYIGIPLGIVLIPAGIAGAVLSKIFPTETGREIASAVLITPLLFYPIVNDAKRIVEDIRYRKGRR